MGQAIIGQRAGCAIETTPSSGLDSYPVWLRTREQRQDLRTASDLRSGRFEAFVSFPSGDDVAGPTKSLVQSPRAAESLIEESISKIGPGCAVLTTECGTVWCCRSDDESTRTGQCAGEHTRIAGRDDDDAIPRATRVQHRSQCAR